MKKLRHIKLFENFLNSDKISSMTFDDFKKEYYRLAEYAKNSEKKGKLDQHHPSYVPMTPDEEKLLAKDWKSFSKQRGFSNEDIDEYEKWFIISGQANKIEGAVNDPWRRNLLHDDYVRNIYVKLGGKEKEKKEKSSSIDLFGIQQKEIKNSKEIKDSEWE
jgi:hypothetical protein